MLRVTQFPRRAGIARQLIVLTAGIEGDVGDAFDAKNTIVGIPGTNIDNTFPLPNLDRSSVETRWDGSIRARAGYLVAPTSWSTAPAALPPGRDGDHRLLGVPQHTGRR